MRDRLRSNSDLRFGLEGEVKVRLNMGSTCESPDSPTRSRALAVAKKSGSRWVYFFPGLVVKDMKSGEHFYTFPWQNRTGDLGFAAVSGTIGAAVCDATSDRKVCDFSGADFEVPV